MADQSGSGSTSPIIVSDLAVDEIVVVNDVGGMEEEVSDPITPVRSTKHPNLPGILTSRPTRSVKGVLNFNGDSIVQDDEVNEGDKELSESKLVLRIDIDTEDTELESIDLFPAPPFVFEENGLAKYSFVLALSLCPTRNQKNGPAKLPKVSELESICWSLNNISVQRDDISPLVELTKILYAFNALSKTYCWTTREMLQVVKEHWKSPKQIGEIVAANSDVHVILARVFTLCLTNDRVKKLKEKLETFAPYKGETFEDFLARGWKRYAVFQPIIPENSAVRLFSTNYLGSYPLPLLALKLHETTDDVTFAGVISLYRSLRGNNCLPLLETPVPGNKGNGNKNKQGDGKKKIVCTRCKKKGHVEKDCRVKLKDDKPGQAKPAVDKKQCSFCGKPGHTDAKCFAKKREKKKQNKNDDGKGKGEMESDDDTSAQTLCVQISECDRCGALGHVLSDCFTGYSDPSAHVNVFDSQKSTLGNLDRPFEKLGVLEFWNGDDACTGILDAGAQLSCMSLKDVQRLRLKVQKRTAIPLQGVGSQHQLSLFVTCAIRLAPFVEAQEFSFLVSNDHSVVPSTLLGLDFQGQFNIRTDHKIGKHDYECNGISLVLGGDSILRLPYESDQLSEDANISMDDIESSESSPDVKLMDAHCYVFAFDSSSKLPTAGSAKWDDGLHRMEKNLQPLTLEELLREKFGDILRDLSQPQQPVERPDWELHINLSTDKKIIMPPRRMSQYHRRLVDEWVKKMLSEDRIEPSLSKKYMNHLCFPKKPNGDVRICLDPTLLNRFTQPMLFSGLCADDVRSSIPHNAKYFSVIDLKDAFWQLQIFLKDREKTTFYTPQGLYQFKSMPFGLTDSSRLFSSWILHVCRDLPFVVPYIDDLVICSASKEEHIEHMRLILSRLKEENIRISIDKLQLGCTEVQHLGLILSGGSLALRKETVQAIDAFNAPRTRTELRSFLGLCRWVEKFVGNLAIMLKPLNRLTSKTVPFNWTNDLNKRFQEIKETLKHHITIQIPDPSLPYTLICDASNIGFGAALLQGDKICGLYSRPWNSTQLNWPTIEQEAFAIVQSFAHWRDLLTGAQITVETDHRPLIWLAESVSAGGGSRKTHRWFCALLPYRYRLVHRPGRYNELADALSRYPNVDSAVAYTFTGVFLESSVLVEEQEPISVFIFENFDINDLLGKFHVWKSIHRSWSATGAEMWKNRSEWDPEFSLSKKQVFELAKQMWKDCILCQSRDSKPLRTELLPTPIPTWCGEVWGADLKDIRSLGIRGHNYLLVLVDYLSKFIIIVGLRNKHSETVKRALEIYWLLPFRPTTCTFDGGGEFDNLLLEDFLFENHVISHRTTARHHESNGQIEVMIREVHRSLTHFDFDVTKDGEIIVASIAAFHNYRVHSGLKLAPAEFMYGRSRIPLDGNTTLEDIVKSRRDDLTQLRRDESKNKIRMKQTVDEKKSAVPVPLLEDDTEVFLHDSEDQRKFKKHVDATVVAQEGKKVFLKVDGSKRILERSIDQVSVKPKSAKTLPKSVTPVNAAVTKKGVQFNPVVEESDESAPQKKLSTDVLPDWIPEKFRTPFENLLNEKPTQMRRLRGTTTGGTKSNDYPYLDTMSEVGNIIDYRVIRRGYRILDRLLFNVQWKDTRYPPEWVECLIGPENASSHLLRDFVLKN